MLTMVYLKDIQIPGSKHRQFEHI